MDTLQYVDSRAFPRCLVANKPRSSRRDPVWKTLPEQPAPAESMATLRKWAQENWHWLNLSRWSRGIPALATPVRERRVDPILHPETMTAEQIDASCDREIPTISREAFEDLGVQALSLDAARRFDDEPDAGTIGEAIGAEALGLLLAEIEDTDLDPLWADALEFALDNLFCSEEEAVSDDFNAEVNVLAHQYVTEELDALRSKIASRYGVAYDVPSPDVRDRIEWEQFQARCTPISREGFRILPDRVEVFSFTDDPADERTFRERRDDFIARFLADKGLTALPKLADWHKRRTILRSLRTNPRVIEPAQVEFQHHLESTLMRAAWTDDDAGMSREIMDEPYVPSLAVLTYQAVQNAMAPFRSGRRDWSEWPERKAEARAAALDEWQAIRRSAGAPTPKHICRNPRQHGGKDEPWHAMPPEHDVDAPVVLLGEVALPEAV